MSHPQPAGQRAARAVLLIASLGFVLTLTLVVFWFVALMLFPEGPVGFCPVAAYWIDRGLRARETKATGTRDAASATARPSKRTFAGTGPLLPEAALQQALERGQIRLVARSA
jgi:hypothetical protein